MITANFNSEIIDGWWSLLRHLNHDVKLELVSKLINSLKTPDPNNKKENWKDLYGSWANSSESAEDLISLIRDSRLSNRNIEPFD